MGISFWQIAIIVLVVVLLFGAGKIPRLMKDLGSGVTAFKKGLKDSDKEEDTATAENDPKVIEHDQTTQKVETDKSKDSNKDRVQG